MTHYQIHVRNANDNRHDILKETRQFSTEEAEQYKRDNPLHTLTAVEDPIVKEAKDVDDRIRNTAQVSKGPATN